MPKKLVVSVANLEDHHIAAIAAAARAHGYAVCFCSGDEEALSQAADAEIIFSASPALAGKAPPLRWLCTPFAGVNAFLGEGVFASPDAVLTHSSGAYGVTIAEHVVMVTLEMLRREPEYRAIIARREWQRGLPVRSIRNNRITLLLYICPMFMAASHRRGTSHCLSCIMERHWPDVDHQELFARLETVSLPSRCATFDLCR